jgi:hypothetical protein
VNTLPSTGECTSEPTLPGTALDGAVIPNAVLKDPNLSAGARLLWVLLAEYRGEGVECSPLEATLASQLGVKIRQLQNYLKELADFALRGSAGAFSPDRSEAWRGEGTEDQKRL